MNKLETTIYEILASTPIDILDETETETLVCSADKWQLSGPRDTGITRIGLFNIWIAMQEICNSYNRSFGDQIVLDKLLEICHNLSTVGLLKESPTYKRNQFKLITNEELNAKREERSTSD